MHTKWPRSARYEQWEREQSVEKYTRFFSLIEKIKEHDPKISQKWIAEQLGKPEWWINTIKRRPTAAIEEADLILLNALLDCLKNNRIKPPSEVDKSSRLDAATIVAAQEEFQRLTTLYPQITYVWVDRHIGASEGWAGGLLNNRTHYSKEEYLARFWALRERLQRGEISPDAQVMEIDLHRQNFNQYISFLLGTFDFLTETDIEHYLYEGEGFVQACRDGQITSISSNTVNLLFKLYNELQEDDRYALTAVETQAELISMIVGLVQPQHQSNLRKMLKTKLNPKTGKLNVPNEKPVVLNDLYLYLKGKVTDGEERAGFINYDLLAKFLEGKLTDSVDTVNYINADYEPSEDFKLADTQVKGGELPGLDNYNIEND